MKKSTQIQEAKTRCIIVHALNKSASMFLFKLFKDFSLEKNIRYFSMNNTPPNHKDINPDIKFDFCFCPVRSFVSGKLRFKKYSNIAEIIDIYQVRDPRDILVSEYFSFGWIHSAGNWKTDRINQRIFIRKHTIDEYALFAAENNFGSWKSLFKRYMPIINVDSSDTRTTIVRYEDMVLNFKPWLTDVARSFGFSNEERIILKYFEKYKNEFIATQETLAHKRKIIPGDHKNKLKPDTIKKLNKIFSEVLKKFNYI